MSNFIDLTGQHFGRWTVIKYGEFRKGQTYWWCECSCENRTTKMVASGKLRSGESKSCGCLKLVSEKVIDEIGNRHGALTVIRRAEVPKGRPKNAFWLCRCDCGKEVVVAGTALRNGHTQSCGECRYHHGSNTRLYGIWAGIRDRCRNKNNKKYHLYGGRGITICKDWEKFENFRDWALQNGFTDNLTIDRIDPNKGYEPSNCRWADIYVQNNNKRTNHYVEYEGEIHTIAEWSRIKNIPQSRLRHRIDAGWDLDEAFTKPNRNHKKEDEKHGR